MNVNAALKAIDVIHEETSEKIFWSTGTSEVNHISLNSDETPSIAF
jgi:hypothetical protein